MKLFKFDGDATIMEKIATVLGTIFAPALYLFMQLSAWQVFKNIYSANVAAAGAGWHVAGLILSIASVAWFWGVATDRNFVTKSDMGNVFILGLLTVFSLLAYGGFVFNG